MRRLPLLAASFLLPACLAMPAVAQTWNAAAAAQYLDRTEETWSTWPRAKLEGNMFCVSCHTTSLYGLSRPVLGAYLKEKTPSFEETKLLSNVEQRVASWDSVGTYYSDQKHGVPKTSEARGTESVFNALVLAARDSATGKLSDDTRRAFRNMWQLQLQKGDAAGSWAWIDFHLEPWEADDSVFYGVAFAAIATGIAPENYAASPDLHDKLEALRTYLQKHVDNETLFNGATAVWASCVLPDLLKPEQTNTVVDRLLKSQAADGGWSMSALGNWKRVDDSAVDTKTDGYATGLAVLALKASKNPAAAQNVRRGEKWLTSHQDQSGNWTAVSVNKHRDPETVPGHFMNDAATALAVLALATPQHR